MANFIVTNANDDTNPGSLRRAIIDANITHGVDTISFEGSVFTDATLDTITLTRGELDVTEGVTITGTGADKLTISGNDNSRVFYATDSLTIDGLTITNGAADSGGGIYSSSSLTVINSTISGNLAFEGSGGGIYSSGSVGVINSTISGNYAYQGGGGIYSSTDGLTTVSVSNSTISVNKAYQGGGIYTTGVATVSNSTISVNKAYQGGGIYTAGVATVGNSTISGNVAYYGGGGIYTTGSATVSNSTISNNLAEQGAGIFNNEYGSPVNISNSIIAGNYNGDEDPNDIYGNNFNGNAYNLIGTPDGMSSGTLGTGTDIVNPNPRLEPLANNGGSTQTHALQPGSLAVNAGDPSYSGGLTTDQRGTGFNRIQGDRLDIGAFESGSGTQPDPIQYVISSNLSSLTEGNSGSQPVTFTVTRSGGIGVASTVDYAFSGTASLGSDYNSQTPSSGTLSFAANETTKTIAVDVLGDTTPEDNEDITVTLSNPNLTSPPESSRITTSSAKVDIINDDVVTSVPTLINEIFFPLPSRDTPKQYIELRGKPGATLAEGTYLVGIEGDSGFPNPGTGNVQDIFDLSGKQFGSNGLLVLLQKGSTYVANSGANVITNTGTGAGWGNGASSSIGHTGSKTDIESGSVSFLLIEAPTAPTVTTDIDSNNDGTADGAAYSSWKVLDSVSFLDGGATDKAYGSIVFKRGAGGSVPTNANATVVKTPFTPVYVGRSGDTTGSTASDWVAGVVTGTGSNLILGTVANTSNANFALQPLNNIGGTNFAPPADVNYAISTSTESVTEGNIGKKPVSFTVTRSGNTAIVSTVNYAFDGTATFNKDYNTIKVAGVTGGLSGALKFAAGETTKVILLNVVGDKLNEANETINLKLNYPNKTAASTPGTITIVNDDSVPAISIADKTGSENSGNLVFTVKLSSVSGQTITVDYNTSDDTAKAGSDYTAVTNTLTFNPGVTTQTIIVPILNDSLVESKESFFVNLVNSTNATIADNKAIATINDDDKLGFAISPAKGLITTEAGGTANFNIQLTTKPTADVTLSLSSSKVSEGTISVPSVTFTADNWNTPQTITVTGVDDGSEDDNTPYQIITAKAVSTDTRYNNLNPADIDVVNIKSGNLVNSIITGTALADTSLQGTSSDDLIFGFAGNDVIVGGEGKDQIYGGLGADNLTGGAGNDIFVLAKGEGRDIIKDFKTGEDLIGLSGGLKFLGLSFTQSGKDALIKVTANNESLALLTGITASTLSASNFITVGSSPL